MVPESHARERLRRSFMDATAMNRTRTSHLWALTDVSVRARVMSAWSARFYPVSGDGKSQVSGGTCETLDGCRRRFWMQHWPFPDRTAHANSQGTRDFLRRIRQTDDSRTVHRLGISQRPEFGKYSPVRSTLTPSSRASRAAPRLDDAAIYPTFRSTTR